jgi:short-subunit dehydrogenase
MGRARIAGAAMGKTKTDSQWALVTGASAGIGAAIARELAARGYSLLLTARRADRLEKLAHELHEVHGTHCRPVAVDLADPAGPLQLFTYCKSEKLPIDMLVNNAGYGVPGALVAQPWDAHRDFIEVMVTAPVALCHLFVPAMRERKRGHVLNVASIAGMMPGTAGHTLYGASKAFLIKFSESLALENKKRGIKVCAVCPGFTYSEFHDVTGSRKLVSQMPGWMWSKAEDVARDGVAATLRGDTVFIPGKVNRVLSTVAKLTPDWLALKLSEGQSKKFRAQE